VGEIVQQGAQNRLSRQRRGLQTPEGLVHEQSGRQAAGGGFQVALHAAQLAAEPEIGDALDGEGRTQHGGRFHIGVAMNAAEAHEGCVRQAWDEAENRLLGIPAEAGLETHHVEESTGQSVLAQLHGGMRPPSRAGIVQPDGFHGAVTQGLPPSIRHHLDGQAGLEKGRIEVVEFGAGRGQECVYKALVRDLVQGAVDEIGVSLAVAGGSEGDGQIDGISFENGRDGVIEEEATAATGLGEPLGQGFCREGPRGKEGRYRRVRGLDQAREPVDVGVTAQLLRDGLGEGLAIHSEGISRRHPGVLRRPQEHGIQASKLRLEYSRSGRGVIALEGVGADHFRCVARAMGRGLGAGTHLVQENLMAALSELPGGFRARQSRPDDRHGVCQRSSPSTPESWGGAGILPREGGIQGLAPLWAGLQARNGRSRTEV